MIADNSVPSINFLSKEAGDRLAAARVYFAALGFGSQATVDHIGVQTYSPVDYERLKDSYNAQLVFLSERVAGGRRIANFSMRHRLPGQDGGPPLFLELFEPTETQVDADRRPWLWHLAFVNERIAQDLTLLEQAGAEILWQLEVGSKRVVFLAGTLGREIEIASEPLESRRLAESASPARRRA
jgi:hypothetical protein